MKLPIQQERIIQFLYRDKKNDKRFCLYIHILLTVENIKTKNLK